MRSYPNLIPLSAKQVTGIAVALEPFQFDTIYGHYFDRVITSGGKRILEISVKRQAKGKTKAKRKKTTPTEATTRRRTRKVGKKLAKKAPARRAPPGHLYSGWGRAGVA
jgi:hypothetical protein